MNLQMGRQHSKFKFLLLTKQCEEKLCGMKCIPTLLHCIVTLEFFKQQKFNFFSDYLSFFCFFHPSIYLLIFSFSVVSLDKSMCIICDDENVIDASSKTMAMRDTTTSQENDCGRSNKELQGVQLENSKILMTTRLK